MLFWGLADLCLPIFLSGVHEFGERYIILVLRMLNSIIVFDLEQMNVLSAYKVDGNIIGYVANEVVSCICITIDREPYQVSFQLHLPKA